MTLPSYFTPSDEHTQAWKKSLEAAPRVGVLPNLERYLAFLDHADDYTYELESFGVRNKKVNWKEDCKLIAYADGRANVLELADAATKGDFAHRGEAIYMISGVIRPQTPLRYKDRNRWVTMTAHAKDEDMLVRKVLAIDLDPKREPKDRSATRAEHEAALICGKLMTCYLWGLLDELGKSRTCLGYGTSGNGFHDLLAVDISETEEVIRVYEAFLKAASRRVVSWGIENVEVDPTLTNASRLLPLYGSKKCKGSEDAKLEIRHRYSSFVGGKPDERLTLEDLKVLTARIVRDLPEDIKPAVKRVPAADAGGLPDNSGAPRKPPNPGWFAFREAISRIPMADVLRNEGLYDGTTVTCPGHREPAAKGTDVAIIESKTPGVQLVNCQHARCADKGDCKATPGTNWTTTGVIMESRSIDRREAQNVLAEVFNIPKPKGRPPGDEPSYDELTRNAEQSPEPCFALGDNAEIARELHKIVARRYSPGMTQGIRVVYDEGAVWAYEQSSGLWVEVPDDFLSREIQAFSGRPAPKKRGKYVTVGSVAEPIRQFQHRVTKPGFFAQAARGVALTNGFAAAIKGEIVIQDLLPEHRARWSYDFDYVAAPNPVRARAYFERVFRGEPDREEKTLCMVEYTGAGILGEGCFNKALLLFDMFGGGGGKSQWLKLLNDGQGISLYPPGSVSAVPPQNFCAEGNTGDFHRALLAGKRANIVHELPSAELSQSDTFKALTDRDPISGRRSRMDPFTFVFMGSQWYSGNGLMGVFEQSDAFYDRWILIHFRQRIRYTADDVKDFYKLMWEERAHIVSWCIQEAAKALHRGALTIPASSSASIAKWREESDAVSTFLRDMTTPVTPEKQPHDGTNKDRLWAYFKEWSEEARQSQKMSRKLFRERLTKLVGEPDKFTTCNAYPFRIRRPEEMEVNASHLQLLERAEATMLSEADADQSSAELEAELEAAEEEERLAHILDDV